MNMKRAPSFIKYFSFGCIGLLLISALVWPLAQRYVKEVQYQRLAEQLADHDQDRMNEINQWFIRLENETGSVCSPEWLSHVQDWSAYSSRIKSVGWVSDNGRSCGSELGHVYARIQHLTPNRRLQIVDIHSAFESQQRLLVFIHRFNDGFLFIEPDLTSTAQQLFHQCQDCFLVSYSSGEHLPVYQYGSLKVESASLEHRLILPHSNITMQINLSSDYVMKLRQRVFSLYVAGCVALALIFGLALFYWTYHRLTPDNLFLNAMRKGEFIPYYQPIIDISKNEVVDVEVLIRWNRAGELIPPNEFIQHLESTAAIHAVTLHLMSQVIHDLGEIEGITASVNVPPNLIESSEFIDQLLALLSSSSLSSNRIGIEVTERVPFSNMNLALQHLKRLKTSGISVKLDDAGTGFGGFSYLQALPFDVLKIDQLFVSTIGHDSPVRSVINEIITFGHSIQIEMVAEGVEQIEQSEYLAERGVVLQQGYYFSPPMPLQTLKTWLAAFEAPSCDSPHIDENEIHQQLSHK
ncbi:hypothetical protein VCRA217O317_150038 [Vibrio crassostreae]|nr:hypothetical protein VCRA217O317_150038 [Vibrio crassostreae]